MSTSVDNWDCPVCLECPEKVYQCTNGHLLCQSCILKVTTCPQCRVPIGVDKIRNLAVERILDEKTFPCKFEDVGCLETPKRKDAAEHTKGCKYGLRFKSLCTLIGYNCNYVTNILKPLEFLEHFQQEHGIQVQEIQNEVTLNLKDVSEAILHSKSFWVPVILKLGNDIEAPKFLIVVRLNKTDDSLSIGCSYLKDPMQQTETSFSLTFCILAKYFKVANIEWTLNPKYFVFGAQLDESLDFPMFRLPISSLSTYSVSENTIKITANVTVSGENPERGKKLRLSGPTLDLLPVKDYMPDYLERYLFTCSTCGIRILVDENCYKCLQCSYILCGGCMIRKCHNHHMFAMLRGLLQRIYMVMVAVTVTKVAVERRYSWTLKGLLPRTYLRESFLPVSAEKPFLSECHNCGSYTIKTKMYTCLLCPMKMNYCQSCVDKDVHRRHILGVILNQEQEDFIELQRKPGSALIPLLASKVNLE